MPAIDVGGAKLEFELTGRPDGGTLMLLHGAGGSASQWREIAAYLGHRFRVVMPKLRGYGESTPWVRGEIPKLETEADGIIQLINAFGGHAHLVGHGYGASVALRVGLVAPHRVSGVTAIEPASFHLLRSGLEADRNIYTSVAQLAVALAQAAMSGGKTAGVERFVEFFSGRGTWAQINIETRRRMCRRIMAIACNVCALAQDRMTLDDYAGYDLPVVIVTGDRTQPPVRRVAERLRSYLPGARQDWLLNAGHMAAMTTHADTVAEMIASHVGVNMYITKQQDVVAA